MKICRPLCLLLSCLLLVFTSFAQKKYAFVSGKVLDENENPLSKVSVSILGRQSGIMTGDSGTFRVKVPADRAFAIVFSYTGYKTDQRNFLLNENEEENISVKLEKGVTTLPGVTVTNQHERDAAGQIQINPKYALSLPTPITGVESLIKIFVGSNNELTSQYNVRGGSYDENLVYVNDFEIFRPYLVNNAQQEGLSFINPELVHNINFYPGGFQAKYGDKMSSVLDIQYNKPKDFGGSAYVGILEQGFHLEGVGAKHKLSYLIGVRNRSNRNLLSKQETTGNYVPSSSDMQALISYQFNSKWQAEFLGNVSQTKFSLQPDFSQLTSSVFSPFFSANLGLDIYFDGQEKDQYTTNMFGVSTTYQANKHVKLKWMASRFENNEEENTDITGAYLFGERDFDRSKPTYGLITNPLGAGLYQDFTRDKLDIADWNISHKGSYEQGRHYFQWGVSYDRTLIDDKLNEWEYQDSAGYSLPYNPNLLALNNVIKSNANLSVNKLSGYLQDNILMNDSARSFNVQVGVRYNYNSLNGQFLLSPRVGTSWKPKWKKDFVFHASAGVYDQPPFYRELRKYDGTLNTAVKAQRSVQGTMGFEYNFKGLGGRPFRWTTDAYYKNMTDVDPYDIVNVRIRYYGNNDAKAYAAGVETRLFGELVKDAESWLSLSIMRTKENIKNDFYTAYKLDSLNQPIDSSKIPGGWFRRPTDRLITLGMFIQDYLSTNKNFKVYLNMLYGSNLPYNIPGSVKYRNALIVDPYIRADLGFSVLLLDAERSNRRSHSPFLGFDNIWASLEIFNVVDRPNTISYMLIKDFANDVFAVPNRLTPRIVNFKIVAKW